MSNHKRKFSDSQRWAIWTVYGMKCFWCKKALEFASCEIDNIIPKATTKIVLKSLAKEYDLGADFSLTGYGNWVPGCRPCIEERSKTAFRPTQVLPGLFKIIRINIPLVEAKVRQIECEQSREALLKQLVEKIEKGEINPEFVKEIIEPFLSGVEVASKTNVEFRLSKSVRLFFSEEGLRMQPPSEIRYEKFVEGLVESSDWKTLSPERIKEGPIFGEGRRRRPGGGA